MKKFTATAAATLSLLVLGGCATTQTSNLPSIDVSKMSDGKVLTAAEIDTVVRGRQVIGDITRTNGNKVINDIWVFEADGTLKGVWPNGSDQGKWSVNQSTNELCNNWIREVSACFKVSVRGGKLLLQNPRTGGQYLQQ